jgi:SH3-like domain-containing protein
MVTAPGAPAAPAAEPRPPAAGQAPAPPPQILYVKVHLANFREGVGTSRRILRVLPQGARLQLLESRASWLRVRLDDGQEGWIAESLTSATAPVTPTRTPAPRRSRPPQIARA